MLVQELVSKDDVAGDCVEAYLATRYSVRWEEAVDTAAGLLSDPVGGAASWAKGDLIPRALSGAPGYRQGSTLNLGTMVESPATDDNKKAIKMLVKGLQIPFSNASGICGGDNGMMSVQFGVDARTGCPVKLNRSQLETMCNLYPSGAIPNHLNAWWEGFLTGTSEDVYIGKYGNSDPLDEKEWIKVAVVMPSSALTATWSGVERSCRNLVTSANFEIMWANSGTEENPQPFITAARVKYGHDQWQFSGVDNDVGKSFTFFTTVTFIEYVKEEAEPYIPQPPPVLPSLPHDLFYPFQRLEGT